MLRQAIDRGKGLLGTRPIPDDDYAAWENLTREFLIKAFGSASHNIKDVCDVGKYGFFSLEESDAEREIRFAANLKTQLTMLDSCIAQLETELDDREIESGSSKTESAINAHKSLMGDPSRIFIIHGRNTDMLEALRLWLESLGLHAKGFDELRADLGGSPTIMEVIRKGMSEARGIIALMTPDEFSVLRPELRRAHDNATDKERWQARPNVIFEAGMAFALAGEKRTLILVAGAADLFSDVAGIHFVRVPHDAAERELLKRTLVSMGCAVRDNPHHHSRGDFAVTAIDRLTTRSPFEN